LTAWESLNVIVPEDIMVPLVLQMSMSVPQALVSMEEPVKMDSMNSSANVSLDLRGKGVRQKWICAKEILANTVGFAQPISIPTAVSVPWDSLETIAKKTSMIVKAVLAKMGARV